MIKYAAFSLWTILERLIKCAADILERLIQHPADFLGTPLRGIHAVVGILSLAGERISAPDRLVHLVFQNFRYLLLRQPGKR